jgi:hypothetical protein
MLPTTEKIIKLAESDKNGQVVLELQKKFNSDIVFRKLVDDTVERIKEAHFKHGISQEIVYNSIANTFLALGITIGRNETIQ